MCNILSAKKTLCDLLKTIWPMGYQICANSGKEEYCIGGHPSLLSDPDFNIF